jgi:hypothetical protein
VHPIDPRVFEQPAMPTALAAAGSLADGDALRPPG